MKPKRFLLLLAIALTAAYLAYCALLAALVDGMLFPQAGRERAAGRVAPDGVEVVWLTLPDGQGRVEGWWLPAPGAHAGRPAPVVLYFHGNAELIDDNLDVADGWHALGVSVLLCEYRGYGRSDGVPGLRFIAGDAVAWYDLAAGLPAVQPDRIIAHGFSLGGACAGQLAARRPLAGLVLESTFSSLPAMGRRQGVWIYLAGERLDTRTVLAGLPAAVPVLLAHGRHDPVIPVDESRRLARARPSATYVEGDYGHYPQVQAEAGRGALRAFWGRVEPAD